MALDRIIEVTVRALPVVGHGGKIVPGDIQSQGNVWCDRRDLGLEDRAEVGGTLNLVTRRWRIRWRRDIWEAASEFLDRVSIVDEGQSFGLTAMIEPEGGRRRYIEFTGVVATAAESEDDDNGGTG
ncbi:MAG: head-tail adaptor protein [Rhodospirillales bacterium]|nr:head-tail adaptor protein [Rhodospirillales bacterium]MCY3701501.1 head-tail adaptor protein [Rhodospirillales bacterium]